MDHHADHVLFQAHRPGGGRVANLVDDLHFEEVVAGAEGAALVAAALHGPVAHVIRLGAAQAAAGLGVFEVAWGGPAAGGQVGHALGQQAAEFLAAEQIRPAGAHAGRDAAEQGVHQRVQPRFRRPRV